MHHFLAVSHKDDGSGPDQAVEQRDESRRAFRHTQRIAPGYCWDVPPESAWIDVRCYDLAQGGFSFFVDEKPAFERLVAKFHSAEPIYVAAKVNYWRPVLVDGWGGIVEPGITAPGGLSTAPHGIEIPRGLPVPAAIRALRTKWQAPGTVRSMVGVPAALARLLPLARQCIIETVGRDFGSVSGVCVADQAMSRIVFLMTVWASLCSLAAGPVGTAGFTVAADDSDSHYEQIELRDHSRYSGLIESEDRDWLTLIRIQSPRGQQMHLVIQPFDRRQILSVSRLDAGQRAALQQQIEEFRNRATIEAAGMEAIRLEPREAEGFNYRHYRSKWFTLDSTADEQNTRRVIVRAEQIFAAYRQIVPPRSASPSRRGWCVLGSMDQYQSLLAKLGLKTKIENPACFLEDQNVVAIGSDLARLAAVTGQITAAERPIAAGTSAIWKTAFPNVSQTVADSLRKSGASNGEIAKRSDSGTRRNS